MEFLESLETNALAVTGLITVVGVLAALGSLWAAIASSRWARKAHSANQEAERLRHEAAEETQRLRLVSQISEVRSQTYSALQRARVLVVQLQTAYRSAAISANALGGSRYLMVKERLDKQSKILDKEIAEYAELVLNRENDKELESADHAKLEELWRLCRIALDQALGNNSDLEREEQQLRRQ